MAEANVYSAPEAVVDDRSAELYQPTFFAASGRIGRLRYLAYTTGLNLLLWIVLMPIVGGMSAMQAGAASGGGIGIVGGIIAGVAYIVMIVMGVIFARRRLNDLDKSGWLMLLYFIPIVNLLIAIYMVFFPGTDGANRWGPPPTPNPLGVKILGLLFPAIFFIGIIAAIALPAYHDYTQRAQQAMEQQQ